LETLLFLSGFFVSRRERQVAVKTTLLSYPATICAPNRTAGRATTCARHERGEGKAKTILFLLFFASMIFIGFKTIPAYVAEYQLADKMQETARFSVVTRQNEEQIRDAIFKVIQDLDIPAKKEDIKVTSTNQLVTINVDYTVPVDLVVYQTEMHFSPSSANKSVF
jgi:hypothetical protein